MPDKTKQLHGRLNKWLHQTVAIQHKLNPAYDPELAAEERPQ